MNEAEASNLLALLHSMAMYNDKGYEWSGHTQAQVEQERRAFEQSLEAFIAYVGPDNIPTQVLEILRSKALASDASGNFVESVERLLRQSSS